MPRRIHLYQRPERIPAPEVVFVTSVVEREEYDPMYRIVRPVERVETLRHEVPNGAVKRQQDLLYNAKLDLLREQAARRKGQLL
jgi:hypothetical protein